VGNIQRKSEAKAKRFARNLGKFKGKKIGEWWIVMEALNSGWFSCYEDVLNCRYDDLLHMISLNQIYKL
jgi:hypothetical protein